MGITLLRWVMPRKKNGCNSEASLFLGCNRIGFRGRADSSCNRRAQASMRGLGTWFNGRKDDFGPGSDANP